MAHKLKLAILSVALIVGLAGLAQAQWDDDDYYRRGDGYQARQYGYQNGYRDGVKQGRHEGRENDPEDFHVPNDDRASRGYRDWMGPIWVYQNAYRDGYRAGFRAGYNSESRTWSYSDQGTYDYPTVYRDGGYYGARYGGFWSNDKAYQIGFRDGASVAREDATRGKPYNPNPRGRYDDEDHGYRGYGDKRAYQAEYARGYRGGYESTRGRY
jgi:hypothetical protein